MISSWSSNGSARKYEKAVLIKYIQQQSQKAPQDKLWKFECMWYKCWFYISKNKFYFVRSNCGSNLFWRPIYIFSSKYSKQNLIKKWFFSITKFLVKYHYYRHRKSFLFVTFAISYHHCSCQKNALVVQWGASQKSYFL